MERPTDTMNEASSQRSDVVPHRTRVKLCGLSRMEDIAYAIDLGADAIGLVFYPPSPRSRRGRCGGLDARYPAVRLRSGALRESDPRLDQRGHEQRSAHDAAISRR